MFRGPIFVLFEPLCGHSDFFRISALVLRHCPCYPRIRSQGLNVSPPFFEFFVIYVVKYP
jgi:hypothetical protein